MSMIVDGTNGLTFNDGTVMPTYPSAGFRNKIIGGDFTTNPWQRGTSFAAAADSTYQADRFIYQVGSDAVVTIAKTADAPTAAEAGVYTQHCWHLDVTTADASIAAAQYAIVGTRIEGLNTASMGFGQAGTRNITLSFWVKSTKTGIFCVAFRNSAADRHYIAEYTVNVTNTWEKKTITLAVDTSGTWLYTTGIGLNLSWAIAVGTDSHGTAGAWAANNRYATVNQVNGLDNVANDFKLALIQLEAGSTATPFESTDVGNVLRQCQRYYYRATSGINTRFGAGFVSATTSASPYISFPTAMRAEPSALEQSGTATHYGVIYAATTATCSAVPTLAAADKYGSAVNFGTAAVLTVGHGVLGYRVDAAGYLGWSAEL